MLHPFVAEAHIGERTELVVPVFSVVPTEVAILVFVNLPDSVPVVSKLHVANKATPRLRILVFVPLLTWRAMKPELADIKRHEA